MLTSEPHQTFVITSKRGRIIAYPFEFAQGLLHHAQFFLAATSVPDARRVRRCQVNKDCRARLVNSIKQLFGQRNLLPNVLRICMAPYFFCCETTEHDCNAALNGGAFR